MYISKLFLTTAAAASTANAVYLTNLNFEGIQPAKPFEITWSEAEGPVQVILLQGDPRDLQQVYPIVFYGTNGKAIWGPSGSLCAGKYAMKIIDKTKIPNYSQMFTLGDGFDTRSTCQARMSLSAETIITILIPTTPSLCYTRPAPNPVPAPANGTTSAAATSYGDATATVTSLPKNNPLCVPGVSAASACFNPAITTGGSTVSVVMNFTLSSIHRSTSASEPTSTPIVVTPEQGTAIEIRSSLTAIVLAFIAAFGMH